MPPLGGASRSGTGMAIGHTDRECRRPVKDSSGRSVPKACVTTLPTRMSCTLPRPGARPVASSTGSSLMRRLRPPPAPLCTNAAWYQVAASHTVRLLLNLLG